MSTGADKIFKIMQKSGVNTISNVVYLTVKSTSPLIFKFDNNINEITEEFYILSDDIIVSRLIVGDKLIAFTFDDNQKFFIHQHLYNKVIKSEIIDTLTSNSILDSLSAKQGKHLKQITDDIDEDLQQTKARVTILEEENADLKRRVEILESKIL